MAESPRTAAAYLEAALGIFPAFIDALGLPTVSTDLLKRAFRQEGGVRAVHLVPVSTYHTSKSVVEETAHLFVASGLHEVDARDAGQHPIY